MAKHITIKVPGKHPQTGELTTFELKGSAWISTSADKLCPSHSREGHRYVAHSHPKRLPHRIARRLAHCALRNP